MLFLFCFFHLSAVTRDEFCRTSSMPAKALFVTVEFFLKSFFIYLLFLYISRQPVAKYVYLSFYFFVVFLNSLFFFCEKVTRGEREEKKQLSMKVVDGKKKKKYCIKFLNNLIHCGKVLYESMSYGKLVLRPF